MPDEMSNSSDSVESEIMKLRRKLERLEKSKQSIGPQSTDRNLLGRTPVDTTEEPSEELDSTRGGRHRIFHATKAVVGEDNSIGAVDHHVYKTKQDDPGAIAVTATADDAVDDSTKVQTRKRNSRRSSWTGKKSKENFQHLSRSTRNLGRRNSNRALMANEEPPGHHPYNDDDSNTVGGMLGDSSDEADTSDHDSNVGSRGHHTDNAWVPLDTVKQNELQSYISHQQDLYREEHSSEAQGLWDVFPSTASANKTQTVVANTYKSTRGGSRMSSEEIQKETMEAPYDPALNNPLLRSRFTRTDSYRSIQKGSNSSNLPKPYVQNESVSNRSDVTYEIQPRKGNLKKSNVSRKSNDSSLMSISSSGVSLGGKPSNRKIPKSRNSFTSIMPVKITTEGEATVVSATVLSREDESYDLSIPPYQQFSLMTANTEALSKDLSYELMFLDGGPRYMDAFNLIHPKTHFVDQFPKASNEIIDSQALSTFGFPDGAKVYFFPKAAYKGALRMGWVGKPADRCHMLVFTNGSGSAKYGVAITVREEYVPMSKSEQVALKKTMELRLSRRAAATKISRWWQQVIQDRVLTEALRIAGFQNHTAADLKVQLSQPELRLLEQSLRHRHISGKDLFGGGIRRTEETANLHKKMKKQGIRRKLKDALSGEGKAKPPEEDRKRANGRELSNEDMISVKNLTSAAIMRTPATRKPHNGMTNDDHSNRNISSSECTLEDKESGLHHRSSKKNSSDHPGQAEDCEMNEDDGKPQKKGGLSGLLNRVDLKSRKQKSSKGLGTRSASGTVRSQKSHGFRSLRSARRMDKPLDDNMTKKSDSTGTTSIKSGLGTIRSCESSEKSSQKEHAHSKKTIKRGIECYETMQANEKLGHVCVVEKCYTLVGCRPEHYTLLLGPLQQLVDFEREESILHTRNIKSARRRSSESASALKKRLGIELERKRREILQTMLDKLHLTKKQMCTTSPSSEMSHLKEKRRYFKADLCVQDMGPIKLPLPLPDVGKQWGVAQLLLTIGPDSLLLAVKLLLLERSILVLGENLQEVTACACGLLELLKPLEWASVFIPVLPLSLLGFVDSPVPFVAGMAVDDSHRVMAVETDERVTQAMANGMSVINLSTNTLLLTTETGVSHMLSLDPYLREQLDFLRTRLQHYIEVDKLSAICSFPRFIKDGLTIKESLTLHSVSHAFEQHFIRYCGDLATSGNAWKRYGTIDAKSGNFNFYPAWFMNPIRAEQFFHEALVHTQLFLGYVEERRNDQIEVDGMRKGEVGKYIATWIYKKWIVRRQRKFNDLIKAEGNYRIRHPSERVSELTG